MEYIVTDTPDNINPGRGWEIRDDYSSELAAIRYDGNEYFRIAKYEKVPTTLDYGIRSVIVIAGITTVVAIAILFKPLIAVPLMTLAIFASLKSIKKLSADDGERRLYISLNPTRQQRRLIQEKQLNEYYAEKEITIGNEPIDIGDFKSLGLDLEKQGTVWRPIKRNSPIDEEVIITLGFAVRSVIATINMLLKSASGKSISKMRRINLDGSKFKNIDEYFHIVDGEYRDSLTEAELKQTWLYRILEALKDNEHIYQIGGFHGAGVIIQA